MPPLTEPDPNDTPQAELFGCDGHGDTNVRGDDPGELGDALPAIDLGS